MTSFGARLGTAYLEGEKTSTGPRLAGLPRMRMLVQTPGGGGGDSTPVECLLSMTTRRRGRWTWRSTRRFTSGRVLVLNSPPALTNAGPSCVSFSRSWFERNCNTRVVKGPSVSGGQAALSYGRAPVTCG